VNREPRLRERERKRERKTVLDRERQTDRETDRQTDRETDRDRQRERERERDIQTDRPAGLAIPTTPRGRRAQRCSTATGATANATLGSAGPAHS
jgi:hypothetical protein